MRGDFAELAGHDAYELLGVAPDASPAAIRDAYRALVKTGHPDLRSDPAAKAEAEENVRLLNAAREILEKRRAAYDSFRAAPPRDEEPVEIIDDPWDYAEPGRAAGPWDHAASGGDPWKTANFGTPPTYAPPREQEYRFRRSRKRRGLLRILLTVVCGTALAYVAAGIIGHFGKTDGPPVAVPEQLAGTWKGKVKDAGHDKTPWKAELTLRAGKHDGDVSYLGGKCTGTAVPISYQANRLTVRTDFPADMSGCGVGDFQLTMRRSGKLTIVYHDTKGKVTASGVLAPSH